VHGAQRPVDWSGFGDWHVDSETILLKFGATSEKGALAVDYDRSSVEDHVVLAADEVHIDYRHAVADRYPAGKS
jgi:hypothetical protein